MKKKKRLLIGIFFIIIFLLFVNIISALGVSPAIKEFNFKPGLEEVIKYKVWYVVYN